MKESVEQQLIKAASAAAGRAYAPYSKFHVGAAIMSRDGRVFTGCNVENASFGLTNCAERTALFCAVAAGCRTFKAIAIVADGEQLPYPCGACRQVLAEFCGRDLDVYVAARDRLDKVKHLNLGDLLPHSFRF
jgi:cytidine deaminase